MKQTTNETKRLEALHRLYYTLAHQVLPEIILSDNVDERLRPNPAGDGLLSEVGTAAIPDTAHQSGPGTENVTSQAHIAGQEEISLEIDSLDFEDELLPIGNTLDPTDAAGYTLDDDLTEDFYRAQDEEDAFDADAAYNDFDAADEAFETDEEDDEAVSEEQADSLIAELESILEFHTLGQAHANPDEAFLDDTWREAWFHTELEDYPANTGYTLRRLNEQGYEIIQFTFPTPIDITDPWQAMAIRKARAPYSYFTLENTTTDDRPKAVLAEWKTGGKHTSYGVTTYAVTDPQAFLNLVLEKLA